MAPFPGCEGHPGRGPRPMARAVGTVLLFFLDRSFSCAFLDRRRAANRRSVWWYRVQPPHLTHRRSMSVRSPAPRAAGPPGATPQWGQAFTVRACPHTRQVVETPASRSYASSTRWTTTSRSGGVLLEVGTVGDELGMTEQPSELSGLPQPDGLLSAPPRRVILAPRSPQQARLLQFVHQVRQRARILVEAEVNPALVISWCQVARNPYCAKRNTHSRRENTRSRHASSVSRPGPAAAGNWSRRDRNAGSRPTEVSSVLCRTSGCG